MAFDATLPANNSLISWAEMRTRIQPFKGAMRRAMHLLVLGALISTCGCKTMVTLHAAKEQTHQSEKREVVVDKKWEPAYYAFLPLTVAGDVVTFPFQLIGLCMLLSYHGC